MALYELEFPSANGRDTIFGWIYAPASTPRGIVQIIHGLGEHSRRYLRLISAFLDAGFVVVADDHAGHGKTAMTSGIWADAGSQADKVVVQDERTLLSLAQERFPGLPLDAWLAQANLNWIKGHGTCRGNALADAQARAAAGV